MGFGIMKAYKSKSQTSWDNAYQGQKKTLKLVSDTTGYFTRSQNKHDFSADQASLFYIFVATLLLGYVYYLNQDTIQGYFKPQGGAKPFTIMIPPPIKVT